jgi:hypothetical protein
MKPRTSIKASGKSSLNRAILLAGKIHDSLKSNRVDDSGEFNIDGSTLSETRHNISELSQRFHELNAYINVYYNEK